jgi:hypothetical protein
MKMMKRRGEFVLSLVCAVALLTLVGCIVEQPVPPPPPGPPPAPAAVGYDYYYYPDEEVYFYPPTGIYFWFGGGGWHSGPHLPPGIVLHTDARVSVRLNTRRPYEHHADIRARYPRRGEGRPEEREHMER